MSKWPTYIQGSIASPTISSLSLPTLLLLPLLSLAAGAKDEPKPRAATSASPDSTQVLLPLVVTFWATAIRKERKKQKMLIKQGWISRQYTSAIAISGHVLGHCYKKRKETVEC